MLKIAIIFTFVLLVQAVPGQYVPSDKSDSIPKPYPYPKNKKYKPKKYDLYVEMSDGVKLAVDYYFPPDYKPGEKYPVIFHQTRYWRSYDLRFPLNLFIDMYKSRQGRIMQDISYNGYILVNADVRGSGASYGCREYPWSEQEVQDGKELLDWISDQPWCNSNIGTFGFSYTGTSAEFLLSTGHPNLKAAILCYSLYDVYDDIAFPGGIKFSYFVNNWGMFNRMLDNNNLGKKSLLAKLAIKGPSRVRSIEKSRQACKNAIRSHKNNWNVDETSKNVRFRDEKSLAFNIGSDDFSPFKNQHILDSLDIPIYSYTGWYDGSYAHSSIRRFINIQNPGNKLLIGPWEHGGKYNCSPANEGPAHFQHISEWLKFFDYHLKGIETGINQEDPIHYFTMGDEEWKSTATWPLQESEYSSFYLSKKGLSKQKGQDSLLEYTIDTTVKTGSISRWEAGLAMLKQSDLYPKWDKFKKGMLTLESSPLKKHLEITGHPLVRLFVQVQDTDLNVHVYLEDISPNGESSMISTGLLKAGHRKLSQDTLYKDVVPVRTYTKADYKPLVPGKVHELYFDLFPTSYVFKKGHKIGLCISGADKSHFEVFLPKDPLIKIHYGSKYPSCIELPIVE